MSTLSMSALRGEADPPPPRIQGPLMTRSGLGSSDLAFVPRSSNSTVRATLNMRIHLGSCFCWEETLASFFLDRLPMSAFGPKRTAERKICGTYGHHGFGS